MNLIYFVVICLLPLRVHASSDSLSLAEVWGEIKQASKAQESANLSTQAAQESKSRADRHWMPKVYLDAKSYLTNDPGASFFGLIEQRSLLQADFVPDAINHPISHVYTRGALGIDWPIYEGGASTAQVDMLENTLTVKRAEASQAEVDQFAMTANAYGTLGAIEYWQSQLRSIQLEVDRLSKSYKLGNKSNPIGYSGLLGMKGLSHRLTAMLRQFDAQRLSERRLLEEYGITKENWRPEYSSAQEFVARFLPIFEKKGFSSSRVFALQKRAEASEKFMAIERSKQLPQVGVFAEAYEFNGNRNTAGGTSIGLYLRWNLFNPTDYGSVHEAELKSLAAAKGSAAIGQQERAELSALAETTKALSANIQTLNESATLLQEQTKVTEDLFKNGSVTALQLLEVYNRRVDLLAQQSEAEVSLIKLSASAITKQKIEIEGLLVAGKGNKK